MERKKKKSTFTAGVIFHCLKIIKSCSLNNVFCRKGGPIVLREFVIFTKTTVGSVILKLGETCGNSDLLSEHQMPLMFAN